MWVSFFFVAAAICSLLYLPGYLAARCLPLGRCTSFAVAPVFSIFLYVLIGAVCGLVGLSVEWWALVAPSLILPAIACFGIRNKHAERESDAKIVEWKTVLLYVLVGIVVVGFIFVKDLNGAGSFAQLYDNAAHLSGIRSMAENGNYSILLYGFYSAEEVSSGIAPIGVIGSFYPAAWHLVTALGSSATGVEASISANASLAVFMAIVFPASVSLLMSKIFQEGNIARLGSLFALAFTAFPWGFLTFGPLYSNLAAFCIVPISVCCISCAFGGAISAKKRVVWVFIFIVSCVSLVSLQPNAVFTVMVLGAPLCVAELIALLKEKGVRARNAAFLCSMSVLVLVGVWAFAWSSSFFEGVVTYPWPPFEGKSQAILGALSLSLRAFTPQWILGILVIVGISWTLAKKRYRYLVVSYLIASAMFVICASTNGVLRSFLTGFWYNDAYRIAALVGLSSIPLASIGAYSVISLLSRLMFRLQAPKLLTTAGCGALVILAAFLVFDPVGLVQGEDSEEPAFCVVNDKLDWLAAEDTRRYTVEEADFVRKAMGLTEHDPGGIVNVPYDGSVFAYGADGANTMFRSYSCIGGASEKPESVLVRERLNLIGDDDSVKKAASVLDAKYVLLLDCGGRDSAVSSLDDGTADLVAYEYRGISSINSRTPGFNLIASEGDMRLYKIDL